MALVVWRNKSDEYAKREHWKIFLVFQKQKAFFTTFNLFSLITKYFYLVLHDPKTFYLDFLFFGFLKIDSCKKFKKWKIFVRTPFCCTPHILINTISTITIQITMYITQKGHIHLKHGKRMCETNINLQENISDYTCNAHNAKTEKQNAFSTTFNLFFPLNTKHFILTF